MWKYNYSILLVNAFELSRAEDVGAGAHQGGGRTAANHEAAANALDALSRVSSPISNSLLRPPLRVIVPPDTAIPANTRH